MEDILNAVSGLGTGIQFLVFLGQNIVVFLAALLFGAAALRMLNRPAAKATARDWYIAAGTVVLNAFVTLAGFILWEQGLIVIDLTWSLRALADFLILFFVMDLLMYAFHLAIHYTFLYRYVHTLHHEAIDPSPIDLFVLHPLETLAFGGMWLLLLMAGTFNIWGISTYLVLNVVFGITGHLGSPPETQRQRSGLLRYLGTARFHHAHHRNGHCNFGFYTSLWDRLFGTFAEK